MLSSLCFAQTQTTEQNTQGNVSSTPAAVIVEETAETVTVQEAQTPSQTATRPSKKADTQKASDTPKEATKCSMKKDCDKSSTKCPKDKCCTADKCAYTTAFGKNYFSFGGSMHFVTSKLSGSTDHLLGGGARIEASMNLYQSDCDKYGVQLVLPLSFDYTSFHGDVDQNTLVFPLYARPYYRIAVCEDLVLTPYVNIGAGGFYSYTNTPAYSDKDLSFMWGAGCGLEVSFMKNYSVTFKYDYVDVEDSPAYYDQALGAELAWKFQKNMVAAFDYAHVFYKSGSTCADVFTLKLRYEF